MPRLLEELENGTPVYAADGTPVGEVRAVYGSGTARVAEFLLVYWNKRDEEALVAADEVTSVNDGGVMLSRSEASYTQLAAFNPSANPLLHRL
jgi:uncharacterized protein YrrD